MVDLLERVNRPQTLGFQADMAHTLLYILGFNAPEDAMLPPDWDWSDPRRLDEAMKKLTAALRPWTIDFHVAQNDATVKGSGTHDKTGHHCLPKDPEGKLKIVHHAGYWLHGEDGRLTNTIRHICWDGCMFPNAVMIKQQTWNDILAAMIGVRDAHGWREDEDEEELEEAGPARKTERAVIRKSKAPKKTKVKAKARKAPKAASKRTARKTPGSQKKKKPSGRAVSRRAKAPRKPARKTAKKRR